jgi:hypothetical protein
MKKLLAPALALLRGVNFYPPQDAGAVTTWMYGPLPAILWAPAVLASTAAGAVLAAGTINLVFNLIAIGATVALWPAELTRAQRLTAGLLAIVIWPFASFQYLQADNVAIALGLLATGCKEKTTEEKLADDLKKSAEKAGEAAKDAGNAVKDAVKK